MSIAENIPTQIANSSNQSVFISDDQKRFYAISKDSFLKLKALYKKAWSEWMGFVRFGRTMRKEPQNRYSPAPDKPDFTMEYSFHSVSYMPHYYLDAHGELACHTAEREFEDGKNARIHWGLDCVREREMHDVCSTYWQARFPYENPDDIPVLGMSEAGIDKLYQDWFRGKSE